ncbi:SDR family NAD(P)-dependent oxidoreductase [Mycobacterium sp. E2497]|uniref:SDR family NAD(P)-dependent oxidoreductase n=1 Tax=Mycobacterium sp. E2497 TaxID=1834135 RepID=UPI0007FD9CDA|nr:SDR family oxidoreductase [Mycobacterium sp. E2497]OBI14124.1 oxidoreductase [Mycobacterium sp. E2497]
MTDGRELAGLVAIVTGAGSQGDGSGDGRACAVLLARAGAKVALVDADADRLTQTENMVGAAGADFLSLTADVATETGCRMVVDSVMRQWGRIDVLVNNVGVVGPPESVVDIDIAEWDSVFRLNVTSTMLMSKYCIPPMQSAGGGSIVVVSSIAGVHTHSRPAYAMTNGALLSLTRSMASRHGPEGIQVNAVAPGSVRTPMVVQAEALAEETRVSRSAMLPLRAGGTAWDVGEAVLHLASPRSRWVTGITLTVDGGLCADLRTSHATTVMPA